MELPYVPWMSKASLYTNHQWKTKKVLLATVIEISHFLMFHL